MHNAGFWVVDALARKLGVSRWRRRLNSEVAEVTVDNLSVLLIKPQTFMNLSGDAVQPVLAYYRLSLDDLLVIYDDLDLPAGAIRIRAAGGAGGHRGVQSLIASLGSPEFARMRIGIDRPPAPLTAAEYVLRPLTKAQRDSFVQTIETAVAAVSTWLREGTVAAMNKYNGAMP